MDILLEGEAGGVFRSRGIIGKDRPGWGGLVSLGGYPVEEGAGYQGTWEAGHQCQVWEKMTKISTLHSLAGIVYLRFKGPSKEAVLGLCRFSQETIIESCSLFLLLWYFR